MNSNEQHLTLTKLARRKKYLDARIVALGERLLEMGRAFEIFGRELQGKHPYSRPDGRMTVFSPDILDVKAAMRIKEERHAAIVERDDAINKLRKAGLF
jgi:hypothetical protein